MNTAAITELLDALARDIPSLPDAACRGTNVHDVATARDRQAVARAAAVCTECPALTPCTEWLDSLPPHRRPWGVVAGRFVKPPWLRPLPERKAKQPTKCDRAADWLVAYLAAGPALSTQLRADAAAAGIDMHNLARARRTLGVQLERLTGVHGGQRWWSLPYNPNQERRNTMTDEPDPAILTDEQIEDLMPRHEDFVLAKVFTLAWGRGQYYIIREAVHAAAQKNPTRFIGALAEMLVRGYDLRDNEQAQEDWRTDIDLHTAAAAAEREQQ